MGGRLSRTQLVAAICLLTSIADAQAPSGVDLAEHGHWKRLKALIEPRVAANPNDAQAQWLLSRQRRRLPHSIPGTPTIVGRLRRWWGIRRRVPACSRRWGLRSVSARKPNP